MNSQSRKCHNKPTDVKTKKGGSTNVTHLSVFTRRADTTACEKNIQLFRASKGSCLLSEELPPVMSLRLYCGYCRHQALKNGQLVCIVPLQHCWTLGHFKQTVEINPAEPEKSQLLFNGSFCLFKKTWHLHYPLCNSITECHH